MNFQLSMAHGLLYLHIFAPMPGTTPMAAPQGTAPPHFKFERGPSGRTIKKGGIEVSFSRFTSEDGTLVERFVEDYKTAQAAAAALQREGKHASKIIQDGYRYDVRGKQVGPRVELLFSRGTSGASQIEVVWIDGPLLYRLRSESRSHLLDFERQVYGTESTNTTPN